MKKYFTYFILSLSAICFLSSCGEDRSGEFYALIEDRMWIEETMQEHYLWYADMPVIENESDYFKEAGTFFKNLLSKNALNNKGDKYSYMEQTTVETESKAITLKRESTYGIEFELRSDPLQTTTHTYAHVLYVLPDSPAEEAGIQRGDWITSINKAKITSDNYALLQTGNGVILSRSQIVDTEEGLAWQTGDTISLPTSIQMEINPFFLDSIYEVNGQKIAYLVYNEFATGPQNEPADNTYNEKLKQLFSRFKTQAPDAFILDLRYNPGGYLQCAQALGSVLAPASALDKDFIKLTFNDKTTPQTQHYPFDVQYAEANLNLEKIYILTSGYTASASEALINCLKPYLGEENVITIGQQTEGKNVAMTSYTNEIYGYTLWPVVAYVFNANDEGDYNDGIAPQYSLNENDYVHWFPLGDTRELLLKNALSLITTGNLPDYTPQTTQKEAAYSSLSQRSFRGVRIP
ncbi:MAG: PDZ domain-containing protein [Bacteroidaceae bacterium]|nr:PDZ domain-containing protein [Bacteroidaceae bacterium]